MGRTITAPCSLDWGFPLAKLSNMLGSDTKPLSGMMWMELSLQLTASSLGEGFLLNEYLVALTDWSPGMEAEESSDSETAQSGGIEGVVVTGI